MMAVWSTWLCIVFALFVPSQANRYKIKVFTGNYNYAGTSAQVSIKLTMENGKCGPTNLTPKNHWWRNTVEEFTINCPSYIGYVKNINIGHDNTGSSAGWWLDKVMVIDLNDNVYFQFPCHAWIDSSHGLRKTLYAHTYKVEIKTGDRRDSGTDASVYITLFGRNKAHCGEKQLDDSSNNFERYRTDTFTLVCPELAEVDSIKIRHNDGGVGPAWYLEKVVVYDVVYGTSYVFTCNTWLCSSRGYDGIVRTFTRPTHTG